MTSSSFQVRALKYEYIVILVSVKSGGLHVTLYTPSEKLETLFFQELASANFAAFRRLYITLKTASSLNNI